MINFTVGPVHSSNVVKEIGAQDVPYFRTPEFSSVMLENERLMKKFTNAGSDARVVFITGSGTASMEATVMNVFTPQDKVLVVNGGSFGHRFVEICQIHDIPYEVISLNTGDALTEEHLKEFDGQGFTGFLVNICETSTGVYYNPKLISDFCRRNNVFLVVDAISSFLADPFDMQSLDVDVMITGSQKALSCPPGISAIVLSKAAVNRVMENKVRSLYFDLKSALRNAERGQTPFTPAVGILLQIHARLNDIDESGGVESEHQKIASLAQDFRTRIKGLPLDIPSDSLSNAVTPLMTRNCDATEIFTILKDEFKIWICPNGGELGKKIFRVGHIGNLTLEDNTRLIVALQELVKREVLK